MDDSNTKSPPAKWRRKTVQERWNWPFNPLPSMVIAGPVVLFCISGIVAAAIWDEFHGRPWDYPEELYFMARATVGTWIITFGLFYLGQLAGVVKKGHGRPRLCNRCFKLTVEKLDHCDCGGTFEDANRWTLNKCRKCGYDLRSTTGRCPECGETPPLIPSEGKPN